MKQVCIIGHFGFGENLLNGQTVKTKIVAKELEFHFEKKKIHCVDTRGGIKALLFLPFQLLKSLLCCLNIVVMPAQNGLRIIAPLLFLFNLIFGRKTHYVVVGGWLPTFLKTRKIIANCLKHFDYIYVETKSMAKLLEKDGFRNVVVLPNFKDISVLSKNKCPDRANEPLRLCTFSRVMKEKGIENAVNAVMIANETLGKDTFVLDIYGQIDQNQKKWFESISKKFPHYISYRGTVPFNQSVDVLKDYFILLFPTYYEGEGFAGTLIDSFCAGVPVIASDWHYNAEIVDDGENGFIVDAFDDEKIAEKLVMCAKNKDVIISMKINCLKKAENFLPENVMKILVSRLSEKRKN